jgi:hypothetical protein
MADIREELSLDGSWALGEPIFAAMVGKLEPMNPRRIVEFGSGRSTVRLAHAFPEATIVSVEHDPEYLAETKRFIAAYSPEAAISVEHRPLCWQTWHGLPYFSYGAGAFGQGVDAVLIDGPPFPTSARGREACLHHVYGSIRIGGRIFLDDYERPAEQDVVANWMRTYPGSFSVEVLGDKKQMCVLTKERDVVPVKRNGVLADLLLVAAETAKDQAQRKLMFWKRR